MNHGHVCNSEDIKAIHKKVIVVVMIGLRALSLSIYIYITTLVHYVSRKLNIALEQLPCFF